MSAGEQGQQHLQHPGQPALKDGAVRQQLGDPGGGAHPQLPGGEEEVVEMLRTMMMLIESQNIWEMTKITQSKMFIHNLFKNVHFNLLAPKELYT